MLHLPSAGGIDVGSRAVPENPLLGPSDPCLGCDDVLCIDVRDIIWVVDSRMPVIALSGADFAAGVCGLLSDVLHPYNSAV